MKRTNLMLFLLYSLLIVMNSVVRKYEVFQVSNDYPRPVLLPNDNNSILATSGGGSGYIMKCNNNAEIITASHVLFPYDVNADIKELLSPNKGIFVCAYGYEKEYTLTVFTESKILNVIYPKHYSVSFKISLLPLLSGNILVRWADNKQNGSGKTIWLSIFSLDRQNKLIEGKKIEWWSDNKYISCVEMN